jgi:hypothetical protein
MENDQASEGGKENDKRGSSSDNDSHQTPRPPPIILRVDAVGGDTGINNPFTVARRAVSNKVQLWAGEARDAVMDAVEKCKKLGLIGVAKEVGKWTKANPWTTAAIVLFLLSLIITPVALSAAGFTGAGIAAGEYSGSLEKESLY